MDLGKAALVISITLVVVILVNLAIYYSLAHRNPKSNSTLGQIEMLRKASQRAKQPWETEDQALEELSRRVKDLNARRKLEEKHPGDTQS